MEIRYRRSVHRGAVGAGGIRLLQEDQAQVLPAGEGRPRVVGLHGPAGEENAEAGKYYWRMTQWIMPYMTMIPPRGDHPTGGHYWVPIDDENCWVWNWDYHETRPLTQAERTAMDNGSSRHVIYEVVNGVRTW